MKAMRYDQKNGDRPICIAPSVADKNWSITNRDDLVLLPSLATIDSPAGRLMRQSKGEAITTKSGS